VRFDFKNILPTGKYDKLALAFCLLYFVGLLVASSFHEMGGYAVETDFYGAFAPGAEALMQGRVELDPGYGPGYEIVLIAFYWIIGDMFEAGKFISMVSAAAMCWLTFKLIRKIFDSQVAFFTMLPLSFVLLPWAVLASTDVSFALLVTASLYLLIKDQKIEFKHLMLSGLLTGFIYITRHNGIALFPAVALILLLINPENLPLRNRAKSLAIFLGFSLVVVAPWMLINYAVNKDALRSDSYLIIASHFYSRPGVTNAEDMAKMSGQFSSLFEVVFYDFKHFVLHYLGNLYRHFRDVLLYSIKLPAGLFVLPGLLLFFRKPSKWQLAFISFPLFGFLLLCLVHYEPRYYLFIISFFVFGAAYFFFGEQNPSPKFRALEFGGGREGVEWYRFLNFGVYAAAIVMLGFASVKELKAVVTNEPLELQLAAQTLKQQAQKGEAIIARKPHLGYLSGLKTIYFPEAQTVDELIAFAKARNAKYLLYGEIERERRPQLMSLLAGANSHHELAEVYRSEQPPMVVYRIN
jgi:hypothetical protein